MSYEKVIGFGVNPDKPKGPPVALTPKEQEYFLRLNVPPIFHDLKKMLPDGNKEPEPKIILPGKRSFKQIRNLISATENTFLIPGQLYQDKFPLTSILVDTVENGFPTALLDKNNYSLRYRFETNPETGEFAQGDFNEKSGLKGAIMIGGCADRFERELEQRPGESINDAYNAFIQKYRHRNDPAFCDQVPFHSLYVAAGYQASRNEIGFAVKHPNHDVMFVFEACEDFWHATKNDMSSVMAQLHEFEFEPKQVWGELPAHIQSKQQFKQFLYETMTSVSDYIHMNTPGAYINMKSKAEITKEHIESHDGFDASTIHELGLVKIFESTVPSGYHKDFNSYQYSLGMGSTLEETLKFADRAMQTNGARLHHQKTRFNSDAPPAALEAVGFGHRFLDFANDNPRRTAIPVASPTRSF